MSTLSSLERSNLIERYRSQLSNYEKNVLAWARTRAFLRGEDQKQALFAPKLRQLRTFYPQDAKEELAKYDANAATLEPSFRSYRAELAAAERDFVQEIHAEFRSLTAQYRSCLTDVLVARCPFCEKEFVWDIDLSGLDGLWWWAFDHEKTPLPCPHFMLMRGAVAFGDNDVRAGMPVCTGPEIPYVVPSLLSDPNVIVVFHYVEMDNGYRIFFMTYYGPEQAQPTQPRVPQGVARFWPDIRAPYTRDALLPDLANDLEPWDFDTPYWVEIERLHYHLFDEWHVYDEWYITSIAYDGTPYYLAEGRSGKLIVADDSIQSIQLAWGL